MGTTVPRSNRGIHLLPDDGHRPADDAKSGTTRFFARNSNRHDRHALPACGRIRRARRTITQTATPFSHSESHRRNLQGYQPVIGGLHPGSCPEFVGANSAECSPGATRILDDPGGPVHQLARSDCPPDRADRLRQSPARGADRPFRRLGHGGPAGDRRPCTAFKA